MNPLREAAQQALEALETGGWNMTAAALRAALAQQVEPDHETRAELAEQQVVQLAEERDHYRNLWQKAQEQAEPVPGAWVASKDGRVIYDDLSADDGLLRVSGDFENDEQRLRYAQRIVDALNAALAQQDEPVAWYSVDQPLNYMTRCADGTEFTNTVVMPAHAVSWAYTAPPQRTMVPLTEEEIDALPWNGSPRQFARAIEKASWEKNHGQA